MNDDDDEEEGIDMKNFLAGFGDAMHGVNIFLADVARRGSSGLLMDVVRILNGVAEEMVVQWFDYRHGGRPVS